MYGQWTPITSSKPVYPAPVKGKQNWIDECKQILFNGHFQKQVTSLRRSQRSAISSQRPRIQNRNSSQSTAQNRFTQNRIRFTNRHQLTVTAPPCRNRKSPTNRSSPRSPTSPWNRRSPTNRFRFRPNRKSLISRLNRKSRINPSPHQNRKSLTNRSPRRKSPTNLSPRLPINLRQNQHSGSSSPALILSQSPPHRPAAAIPSLHCRCVNS